MKPIRREKKWMGSHGIILAYTAGYLLDSYLHNICSLAEEEKKTNKTDVCVCVRV